MDTTADALAIAAVLCAALLAGVYFAFDVIVLPGLRRRPAAEALAGMQEFNRAALRPGFLVFFFASPLLAVASAVLAVVAAEGATTVTRVIADAFILGSFVVTIAANVPRNRAIAALDPYASDVMKKWRARERGWTIANRARAGFAFVGAATLIPTLLR